MTDMVNNPPHYGDGPYQTIKVIEAWELNYRLGNVVKYVSRAHRKGHQLEDLKKASWYLTREIAAVEWEMEKVEFPAPVDVEQPTDAGNSRKSGNCYIAAYTDVTRDKFSQYGVYAFTDSSVETIATRIAEESGAWACGTFTLRVGSVTKPENTAVVNGSNTVAWLLKTYPPTKFSYHLEKVGL